MLPRLQTLRSKLIIAFLVVIAFHHVIIGLSGSNNRKLHRFLEERVEQSQLESYVEEYAHRLQDISTGLFMIAAGEEGSGRSFVLEAGSALESLEQQLARMRRERSSIRYDQLSPLLDIRVELGAHASATIAVMEASTTADPAAHAHMQSAVHVAMAKAAMLAERADLHVSRIEAMLRENTAVNIREAAALASRSRAIMITLSTLALVGGMMVGWLLARSIARRLRALESATEGFGSGDFSRRITESAPDELGRVARTFNSMADAVAASIDERLSREYVEKLINTMKSGLVVLRGDHTVERVNRALLELLGYGEDELIGRPVEALVATGGATETQSEKLAVLCGGTAGALELELLTATGGRVPVACSSALMSDTVHGAERIVCVMDDITERRLLIEQLLLAKQSAENATTAKTAFLTAMSHDLRTPLNGILGYIQILNLEGDLSERQREALEIMQQSGEHLLTLLNDLLDISKIEAQRMELETTELHLTMMLKNLIEIFRVRAEEKQIQFLYEELSALPIAVRGDETRLRQVLINLLGNAIKFTEAGGVALKVGMHYGKIRFQVEDTGVGIAREHLSEIFAPFRRVGAISQRVDGSGLGLAISKRLAEMMGGELRVRSQPGKGSVFWLDLALPVVEGYLNHDNSAKRVIGYQGERRSVLVVDDEIDNRTVLTGMLAPLGFVLWEATNGLEALARAEEGRPDIILMDLEMPEMGGLEATRRLRAEPHFADTVVIAVSASAFDEDRSESMAAGCNGCVTKPVGLDILLVELSRRTGIEWLYEAEQARPGLQTSTAPDADMVMPPVEKLAALYELARRGDIKSIRSSLDQLGSEHAVFSDKLRALTKQYRIKEIRDLLQAHLPAVSAG